MNVEERFWNKVDFKPGDCWRWKGGISGNGYGVFSVDYRSVSAHRFSFEMHNGKILSDLTIDHLCRTPECVNPLHMELVTMEVNYRRGLGTGGRNHCPYGHLLEGNNLYLVASTGARHCKQCKKEQMRKYRRQKIWQTFTECRANQEKL